MNYIVIISAIITVILVFLTKYFKLSIVYPTLMIILTIVLDIVSNKLRFNKDKKERINLSNIINKNKLK